MTDKLKELVAKHIKTVREFVEHSQDSGDPGGGCQRCWDLFARVTKEADELEAILAEQAPAGEWDALAAEKFLQRHYNVALAMGDTSEPERVHISGWLNLVSMAKELNELAAGQSSQPIEPRDPAEK